jgi:hypothetical protein
MNENCKYLLYLLFQYILFLIIYLFLVYHNEMNRLQGELRDAQSKIAELQMERKLCVMLHGGTSNYMGLPLLPSMASSLLPGVSPSPIFALPGSSSSVLPSPSVVQSTPQYHNDGYGYNANYRDNSGYRGYKRGSGSGGYQNRGRGRGNNRGRGNYSGGNNNNSMRSQLEEALASTARLQEQVNSLGLSGSTPSSAGGAGTSSGPANP